MNSRIGLWFLKIWLVVFLLAACTPQVDFVNRSPTQQDHASPTLTPFQPLPAGTVPASSELPDPSVKEPVESTTSTGFPPPNISEPTSVSTSDNTVNNSLWIDPHLPPGVSQTVSIPLGLEIQSAPDNAALRLGIGYENLVSYWVYALVAPFPTVTDEVSNDVLQRAWQREALGPFGGQPILMDEPTLAALSAFWGSPAVQAVQVYPAEQLLDQAWKMGRAWAIVPFEALEPRWKVLYVDGQSPVRKSFAANTYALSLPISLAGPPELIAAFGAPLTPVSNRDPGKLTVVAMTGVTALVRATAFAMEQRGVLYPGRDISALLSEADITHISNEVPFAQNCPYPDPVQAGMRFCSDPTYIQLLESVGTDIVELTGDHFQDWGAEAMRLTLRMYQERGWPYYGGGANIEEARQAVMITHNGNPLAFIGCNAKGGSFAQASANNPGAFACGYDWMANEIARLKSDGYLPIATYQHFEYYTYPAQDNQKRDFRRMAEAGAVIVSGSQAHQPQAFEFKTQALIHYGLGNLFFDQYDVSLAARQGFVDYHIFYGGRYISTELLTHMFVDYARPRIMTSDERRDLLTKVFRASGW